MAGEYPEGTLVCYTILIFFKTTAGAEESSLQNELHRPPAAIFSHCFPIKLQS